MNISTINNYQHPNFQATKIAKIGTEIKGRGISEIDIYALDRGDRDFLIKLKSKVNFKKLFPKLNERLQIRWQKVLRYTIECAHDPDNRSYVAIQDNKPCGIITYTPGNSFFLEGLCTIPQEPNKKVPFVGDRLLYQLFLDAKANEASDIKLDAVTDGPFDVIKKYEARGFKKDPTTVPYTQMRCNKHRIKEQLHEFPYRHVYTETEPERTTLDKFID